MRHLSSPAAQHAARSAAAKPLIAGSVKPRRAAAAAATPAAAHRCTCDISESDSSRSSALVGAAFAPHAAQQPAAPPRHRYRYRYRCSSSDGRAQQHAAASSAVVCRAAPAEASGGVPPPLVAVEGDIVTIHFAAKTPDGDVIETTRAGDGEPLTFEIGAGDVMGNPIFKAFDGAVRGLGVGEAVELEMSGGDWRPELLFEVPRDHPEVERLEGRYKK